jgi:hypothetical protein
MATFTADIVFSAGAANTGQAANVLYTVIDAGGVTRIASTGSGISEETDAAGNTVTGVYRANVTLDTSWQFPLRIKFVITGKAGVAGLGSFGQDRAILNNDGFTPTRAGYLDTLNGLVASTWSYLTSAATTAGSLGKLLVDNIDATISSRLAASGYTAPYNTTIANIYSAIDTEVAAIKAKTDNLPADPASNTQVNTRLAASGYTAPPTAATVASTTAAAVLATPANKIVTDASGNVSIGISQVYVLPIGQARPAATIYLSAGATSPDLLMTLRDSMLRPIQIGNNSTIVFTLKSSTGTVIYSSSVGCSVEWANGGMIKFSWSTAGISVPAAGDYIIQFSLNGLLYPIEGAIPLVTR